MLMYIKLSKAIYLKQFNQEKNVAGPLTKVCIPLPENILALLAIMS